jgi:hypothetical protein
MIRLFICTGWAHVKYTVPVSLPHQNWRRLIDIFRYVKDVMNNEMDVDFSVFVFVFVVTKRCRGGLKTERELEYIVKKHRGGVSKVITFFNQRVQKM